MIVIPVENLLQPYSFMKYIFLDTERYDRDSLKSLIIHEKAHINQLHYLDLLWLGFFRRIFWFNPVLWFLNRKLQENHEYLADRSVYKSGVEMLDYYLLLAKHSFSEDPGFLRSSFNGFSIIKRINMMKTINKKRTIVKKSLWAFALVFLTITGYGFINQSAGTANESYNSESMPIVNDGIPSIPPVDLSRVKKTSGFGMRMHPIKKVKMMHRGIDLAAELGTPVYVTADGEVIKVDYKPEGHGNYIIVRHSNAYETMYSQLSETLVKEGMQVKSGTQIGKVGSSGISTGPHLHYEVHKDGKAVDPEAFFGD